MRTHYFKKYLLIALCILISQVNAENSILTDEDKALKNLAKSIREQSSQIELPVNIHQIEAKAQADQLFNTLREEQFDQFKIPHKKDKQGRILFFASQSEPIHELEDIFYASTAYPEAVVVFRGVKDPDNMTRSIMEIQQIAARQTPVANVMIDPSLYRNYGISKVPTILYLDEDKETELARVAGLTEPGWLLRQVKSGSLRDFGVKGPVEEILERDLIEVMKERVASIDWENKKEQAIKRYWEKQRFIELPRARKNRRRELDPSILISDDIKDAEGNVLVAKGTVINPLELRSFNQALVIFDPLDPVQVSLVDQKLPEITKQYPRLTLIVTRFDKEKGWDSYKNITDHFDSEVFNLTPDIQSRFELEYTPSLVTAEQYNFIIEELAVEEK